MGRVVRLVKYQNRESIAILRELLAMAERGDLSGFALCMQTMDRREHTVFTGVYKASPAATASAAMRISWRMAQMDSSFA